MNKKNKIRQRKIAKRRWFSILVASLLVNCFVQVNSARANNHDYEAEILRILKLSNELQKEYSNFNRYMELQEGNKITKETANKDIKYLIGIKNLDPVQEEWNDFSKRLCGEEKNNCPSEKIAALIEDIDQIFIEIDGVTKELQGIILPTPKPTVEETPKPTAEETPTPTVEETPKPTAEETPTPTVKETPTPTVEDSDLLVKVKDKVSEVNNEQFYNLESNLFQLNTALINVEKPNWLADTIANFNRTILPIVFLLLGGLLTWRIWNFLKSLKDSDSSKLQAFQGLDPSKLQALQGLDPSKLQALQGLDPSKLQALQGLDLAKLQALQGLDLAKLQALQGLDLSQVQALQGLDLSQVQALQGLDPSKLQALQGLDLAKLQTSKTNQNNQQVKSQTSILLTLKNSKDLEDLIANYNSKTLNKNKIIKVAATQESIEQRRNGQDTPLIFAQESEDNETYWVVNQYRLQDNCYFLVPKFGLIINDRNYQTIKDIFMCEGYDNRESNKFKLILPAVVKSRSNNGWEFVESGELTFRQN